MNGGKKIVRSDFMLSDDDLMNILAQINLWINNCDTKASILLALIGIVVNVVFSNDFSYRLISIYHLNPLPCSIELILYSIFLIISLILIIHGIIRLILCILPQFSFNESNKDSLIYYASISENSIDEYFNKIKNQEYSLSNDLISQIHINANICTEKFENYKLGLISTIVGFIFLVILILVRYTIYAI